MEAGTPRTRKRRRPVSRAHLAPLILTALLHLRAGEAFREVDDQGTSSQVFQPYAKGFVGKYGDPFTTFLNERVNEGAPSTPSQPVIYDGVHPRQTCPSMVGPLGDGLFYCISREHGYCDRRSGTCVCSIGYAGLACAQCSQTHYAEGNLCYPKLVCPNDCSGAGSCDFSTGLCTCEVFRTGDDCSAFACSAVFDPLCESCSNTTCSSCRHGYSVDVVDNTCQECARFDPRCIECDSTGCVACADPLLYSTRRSGRQMYDPELPADEWTRQLRHALPFGSQSSQFFDDVDVFQVVRNASSPLNETAMDCHQGLTGYGGGSKWTCFAAQAGSVSHRVCGSPGTLVWASPEYEVPEGLEGNGTVRVTVVRSGGGYGDVTVQYELHHLTTTDSDATSHSVSEDSQLLTLAEGVVSVSFLITVHDDSVLEGDEAFELHLLSPTGGARLGPQRVTKVWIRDDDAGATGAETSLCSGDALAEAEAGVVMNFTIFSYSTSSVAQQAGGDSWVVYLEDHDDSWEGQYGQSASRRTNGWVVDEGNGNYTASYIVQQAGLRELHVLLAHQGGLQGVYFGDTFLGLQSGDDSHVQVDRQIDMTWPNGRVTAQSGGYSSVRWQGYLLPPSTEEHTLSVTMGGAFGQARVWVDDIILIDIGDFGSVAGGLGSLRQADNSSGSAAVMLTQGHLHSLVVDYRSRRGAAGISLQWESSVTPLEVIPYTALYWAEEVQGSPWPVQVLSSSTDGRWSEAYGVGLSSAVVAQASTFTIVPRDAYGNLRGDVMDAFTAKSDAFKAVLALYEGVADGDGDGAGGGGVGAFQVTASMEYNPGRATFEVTYTPYVSGVYLLNVTHQAWGADEARHIQGSPFTVVIEPGPTFAKRCRVEGMDLLTNVTAGVVNNMTVVARDVMDNLRLKGGDDIEVFVHNLKHPYVHEGLGEDNRDGTYNITMWPVVAGPSSVSITLNGHHLAQSPYDITVYPAAAYGAACSAFGAGTVSAVATVDASFYVQARDRFGNDLWDTNNFTVNSSIMAEERWHDRQPEDNIGAEHYSVTADALYLGNGSGLAWVTYRAELSGASQLSVEVNGRAVRGSPFPVLVEGGPSTGNATASGSSLSFAVAGNLHSFMIQARDSSGNPTEIVGEEDGLDNASGANCSSPFNVTLVGGRTGDAVYWGWVVREDTNLDGVQGDSTTPVGLYRAEYNVTETGNYSLLVVDCQSGEHIIGSPFQLYVGPNIAYAPNTVRWWKKQVAGRNKVMLQAQDFWGNNATAGGERFIVTWEPSDTLTYAPSFVTADLPARVVDLGDGTYHMYTDAVGAGDYNMTIYIIEGGGLWGQFHGATDCVSEKADWYMKGAVDMDWGLSSPGTVYGYDIEGNATSANATDPDAFPADYFSIVFGGYVIAPGDKEDKFGEMYTFFVTTDATSLVKLSIGGSVLVDEIAKAEDRSVIKKERRVTYLLGAGTPTNVELRYVHMDANASVTLEWMSATTPRQVIPASVLAHARPGWSDDITLWPAEAVAWASTTEGAGLSVARVGVLSSFVVTARDEFGNQQWHGGLTPTAYARGSSGAMLYCTMMDNHDGTYNASYYPTHSGVFVLAVALGGLDSAEWDMGYNSVEDMMAAAYTNSSPMSLIIHTGPTATNTTRVYDNNGADLSTSTAGGMYGQSTFVIQARDKHGNRRIGQRRGGDGEVQESDSSDKGVDSFSVVLRHTTDKHAVVNGNVSFRGAGEYLVTYNATVAGDYDVHIALLPAGEELIKSPLTVLPGPAHGPSSMWTVARNKNPRSFLAASDADPTLSNGATLMISLTAMDRWGNARKNGGEDWYVEVRGPDGGYRGRQYYAPVRDLGDGTYRFKFSPSGVGWHELHISLAKRIQHEQRLPALGGGGLHGTYWTNILMSGDPAVQRDDAAPLNYNWGTGAVIVPGTTGGQGDYVSVRWSGLIRPEFSSTYTLELRADDQAQLFVSENLVIDTSSGTNTGRYTFVAEQLERIRVEYVELTGAARVALYWSCLSTPRQLVPPARLFPTDEEVEGSPFTATVIATVTS